MICSTLKLHLNIKDIINMFETKYKFEFLTPTDNVDLTIYEGTIEGAINFLFENPDKCYYFIGI